MIIASLRLLARLLGVCLLILLAAAGAAAAVFCIDGGHGTLSLTSLAHDIQLPQLRDQVGPFLHRLEVGRATALIAGLAGVLAVLLGLGLIAGALAPARERLVALGATEQGKFAARRRPLASAARALAETAPGVVGVRAAAHAGRAGRDGRLRLRVAHNASVTDDGTVSEVSRALDPMTEPLPLTYRITSRSHAGRGRS